MMHDLRGVYIVAREGRYVTGHTIHFLGSIDTPRGRPTVRKFTKCSLKFVIEDASNFIDDPKVYELSNRPQPIALEQTCLP